MRSQSIRSGGTVAEAMWWVGGEVRLYNHSSAQHAGFSHRSITKNYFVPELMCKFSYSSFSSISLHFSSFHFSIKVIHAMHQMHTINEQLKLGKWNTCYSMKNHSEIVDKTKHKYMCNCASRWVFKKTKLSIWVFSLGNHTPYSDHRTD